MQCKGCRGLHAGNHEYKNTPEFAELTSKLLDLDWKFKVIEAHVRKAINSNPGMWEWTDLELIQWKVDATKLLGMTPPYSIPAPVEHAPAQAPE